MIFILVFLHHFDIFSVGGLYHICKAVWPEAVAGGPPAVNRRPATSFEGGIDGDNSRGGAAALDRTAFLKRGFTNEVLDLSKND